MWFPRHLRTKSALQEQGAGVQRVKRVRGGLSFRLRACWQVKGGASPPRQGEYTLSWPAGRLTCEKPPRSPSHKSPVQQPPNDEMHVTPTSARHPVPFGSGRQKKHPLGNFHKITNNKSPHMRITPLTKAPPPRDFRPTCIGTARLLLSGGLTDRSKTQRSPLGGTSPKEPRNRMAATIALKRTSANRHWRGVVLFVSKAPPSPPPQR